MDKQNERLQQYSDAERLMTSQIQTLEKSVIAANAATIVHQQKLDDNIQACKEHFLSIDKMSAKLSEYNLIFTEKTRDLQVEKAKHISLSEQIEVLNSKLLNLEKTDADAASAKQIFDLKKLLKCTSCDNNFKSHVLARCMHCFCKECIETVYESRQRKCPTCGIAFSREDMKQFYL